VHRGHSAWTLADGVVVRCFAGANGGVEYHLTVCVPGGPGFIRQLDLLERRYAQALDRLDLSPATAVFRRVFLSDGINQAPLVAASTLGDRDAGNPVAVSIIQQPPLPDAKIALQAYHLFDREPLVKRRLSPRHLVVSRNGGRHLWSTGLCAGATSPPASAEDQTGFVFASLVDALAKQGATLAGHCLRTWIYIRDVDVFYGGMVDSRNKLFARHGLVPDSHFIASTGIEGGCAHPFDVVAMDAYSAPDVQPRQISYLNDAAFLCPTTLYNVAFERGTRIAYRDRSHIFISGTASIDGQGRIVHPGDVAAQTERTLGNIAALLRTAGAGLDDLVSVTVYLRDGSDLPVVRDWLSHRLAGVPAMFVRAPVCRPGWLVEIEGMAITANRQPEMPEF
jgi:enamine deaminase RidA (YjgF/YER057c/UK114 family)